MVPIRKIINDPVYGFITIDHPLVMQVVAHPYYQRLRRIHQMALAHLVYPGAVHTRLHHSLGAYHLMRQALDELRRKGFSITDEEAVAAQLAILLHDIGHGPFSHALEGVLVQQVHHETMGLAIMHRLNIELNGALDMAIAIFTNQYPKRFLHQLISGQLDVDRMDYLTRDSFFTGVSEGVIGYDRIIKMLTVHQGDLMVEEKAIYSIEKFLVARRLMYWQVYLHKTVLGAEMMLVKMVERARLLHASQPGTVPATSIDFLLHNEGLSDENTLLERFIQLDDADVVAATKAWRQSPDKVLSTLAANLLDRRLFKVVMKAEPFDEALVREKQADIAGRLGISMADAEYFAFTGHATNTTYKTDDERISILFKDGTVRDISEVDNALIQKSLAATVGKHYFCWLRTD
jgi:HD superfamily phosphohydrolase